MLVVYDEPNATFIIFRVTQNDVRCKNPFAPPHSLHPLVVVCHICTSGYASSMLRSLQKLVSTYNL